MKNFEIKRVTHKDIPQLQKLSRQTFFETFSLVNSEQNMNIYLEKELSMEKLTAELEDNNSEFYFGTLNDEAIGYLKINFGESQTELKDEKAIEIERIYVLKEFHRKKVGQCLYEKALQIAKQKNAQYIWLGVWEKNDRAIHFYKKNGFDEFDKHFFKLGSDEQTDIMMKLALQ